MIYCKFCDTPCDDHASFCPQCGQALSLDKSFLSGPEKKEPLVASSSTSGYTIGRQQIELSYFWYKFMYLLGAVALSGAILPWLGNFRTSVKLLWSAGFLIIFSALSYFAVRHHNYVAGIAKNEDYYKLGGFYEQQFGKKLKLIIAVSILIGIAISLTSLKSGDIWDALQIGILLGLLSFPFLCIIWTFRVPGFVIAIGIFVGIGGLANSQIAPQTSSVNRQSEQSNQENQEKSAPVRILGATLSEYAEKEVLVVTYEWSNQSQESIMPISDITVTAFQGGIELEEALFYNIGDDLSVSEIQPGTTIELETAFYLRTHEDVEFEIAPAFDFSGEVYATTVFQLED